VLVAGSTATKPARLVAASDPVELLGPGPRFVSRGGDKLDAALERFRVDVTGSRALDAGSSTGGFVDCLLQRGAVEVVAVDVGRGQLDARLRADARVRLHEGVNIRFADPEGLGLAEPVDLVTADLSFISLRAVAAALVGLVRVGGDMILLVKPQFEAGRSEVSRGKGVIRDPELWREGLRSVASALVGVGTGIMGVTASPLRGAAGNVEFFVHVRSSEPPTAEDRVGTLVDAAIASVGTAG
jgi:23S rRNA (cytidine1920-2'-O)/16S rRNA (cytidine1409-2'-O)-methyltransferase